ncbi:MAG: hypothetical protein EHM81_09320, partial [Chloroflexi bacterium]
MEILSAIIPLWAGKQYSTLHAQAFDRGIISMTLQYADLEISIHRRDEGTYSVDFRLSRPDSDETRTDRSEIKQSDLDFDGLADACYDSDEYSRKLTGGFFKSQGVK